MHEATFPVRPPKIWALPSTRQLILGPGETVEMAIFSYSFHTAGCPEGGVRLTGGTTHTEGHVEICMNNQWGAVCDTMWDTMDASVVCRQLGLETTGIVMFL